MTHSRWAWVTALGLVACGSDGGGGNATDGGAASGGVGGAAASGGASGNGAGGNGASSTGGNGATGGGPQTTGCLGPPKSDFDPIAGYRAPELTADVTVTSEADDGPGSLRAALASVKENGVVGFDAALAGKTIALASTLQVERSLTIDASDAPGVVLDGGGARQIMNTAKALDTRFIGLTFRNGKTDGRGGALDVGQSDPELNKIGTTQVLGCRFEKNAGGRGGAIHFGWRTKALVEDSSFSENDGSGGPENERGFSGGAISTHQSAELIVRRSRFEKNIGWNGGAVYNILQPLTIEDSVFIDNVGASGEGGGAIFTDGGNSVGPSNDPNTGEVGTIALRRLYVKGSQGKGYGGALLLWGYPRDAITIEDSAFFENTCTRGSDGSGKGGVGRIHALDRLVVKNSVFAKNKTSQQGGALWLDGSGPFRFENLTFSENEVEDDTGGAFTFNGDGKVEIEGVTFADNVAGRACGAFWFGKSDLDITVSNSIFVGNQGLQDIEQRHVGYKPKDGGGNLEWAIDSPGRGRVSPNSAFADPFLEPLAAAGATWVRPLGTGSPAIDGATASAPERDQSGAKRVGGPDVGAAERGGDCSRP